MTKKKANKQNGAQKACAPHVWDCEISPNLHHGGIEISIMCRKCTASAFLEFPLCGEPYGTIMGMNDKVIVDTTEPKKGVKP